jgi:predicted MarR family transcription regulator
MNPELSNNDGLILQKLWEMKALGTRAVSIHDLVSHLSSIPITETTERLERLQALALITRTKRGSDHLVALSPFGTALVRQLQDKRLGDLTRGA